VTLRCHLPIVGNGRVCEVRSPQRQTSENVFLIYKTARLPTAGLTSDAAKIDNNLEKPKKNEENVTFLSFYVKKQLFSSKNTEELIAYHT
jgi:hypothetical protein